MTTGADKLIRLRYKDLKDDLSPLRLPDADTWALMDTETRAEVTKNLHSILDAKLALLTLWSDAAACATGRS